MWPRSLKLICVFVSATVFIMMVKAHWSVQAQYYDDNGNVCETSMCINGDGEPSGGGDVCGGLCDGGYNEYIEGPDGGGPPPNLAR